MVSAVTEAGAGQTFDALAAGAFDYVPKQMSASSLDILHIRARPRRQDSRRRAIAETVHTPPSPGEKPPQSQLSKLATRLPSPRPRSLPSELPTGGPKALQEILPLLPLDLPVPILIVQHMPPGFTAPFAQRLNHLCSLEVREATHRETIQPGVVYIAPAGLHMSVERLSISRVILCLDTHPEDCLHIPSVNVLMNSVAVAFKNLALGVIMTGMGSDGAEGMNAIHRQGGLTIGQNEATCTVYGMPRACADLGVLTRVVPSPEADSRSNPASYALPQTCLSRSSLSRHHAPSPCDVQQLPHRPQQRFASRTASHKHSSGIASSRPSVPHIQLPATP